MYYQEGNIPQGRSQNPYQQQSNQNYEGYDHYGTNR
jgi:hypothetical protein